MSRDDVGRVGSAETGSRASMEPSCTVSALSGFDPARLFLAAAYERTDCLTMPDTILSCDRAILAQPIQVALEALDDLIREISDVDYWEGNGDHLIENVVQNWLRWRRLKAIADRNPEGRDAEERLGAEHESAGRKASTKAYRPSGEQ